MRQVAWPATYTDRECGFRFSYSRVWTVTREPIPDETEPCGYAIVFTRKGPAGTDVRHLVNIYLSDYGKWYQNAGMSGTGEAYKIHGKNWVGMQQSGWSGTVL